MPGQENLTLKSSLLKMLEKGKGATLYLNLEPCTHYGSTPSAFLP
jgi:pyrimidine deaminase RibD-like protein